MIEGRHQAVLDHPVRRLFLARLQNRLSLTEKDLSAELPAQAAAFSSWHLEVLLAVDFIRRSGPDTYVSVVKHDALVHEHLSTVPACQHPLNEPLKALDGELREQGQLPAAW